MVSLLGEPKCVYQEKLPACQVYPNCGGERTAPPPSPRQGGFEIFWSWILQGNKGKLTSASSKQVVNEWVKPFFLSTYVFSLGRVIGDTSNMGYQVAINVLRSRDLHTAPVVQENPRYQERSTGTYVTGLFNVGCIFHVISELSTDEYRPRAFASMAIQDPLNR